MIQKANTAYNAKDYKTAFELYTILAEKGDAAAQTSLAFMHQKSQGCEVNEERTLELYTKAAEANQPYALFNLAILYENGIGGVEHDQFKAHDLHLKAAEREVPPAQYVRSFLFLCPILQFQQGSYKSSYPSIILLNNNYLATPR
jgi:TPR repeat protein